MAEMRKLFREAPCVLGPMLEKLLSTFSLDDPCLKQVLLGVLLMGQVDTVPIECIHAVWHRMCKSLGVQTWCPDYRDVKARYIAQQVRSRKKGDRVQAPLPKEDGRLESVSSPIPMHEL